MKEKKKRKILAALIPVAVLFLAAVVFAQGVLKSESEAVPNPVQGISADSSLKGYLGTGFAYAGSKNDRNGEEMAEQQEQAQLLPEETPTPTITPEPNKLESMVSSVANLRFFPSSESVRATESIG